MESDKNVLKVRIYGAEYLIRGQADVNYMQSVAEYVNDKMLEIDQNIRTDSSLKVAILATLNITDELFRERAESEATRNELENKIRELNLLIDRQLSRSDL
jgi:cell division protein ZapA